MTVRYTNIPRDPYLGYDAVEVAQMAVACLLCEYPAPCTRACPRESDIPRVMRLAGHAACEGLAFTNWYNDRETIEASRITNLITDSYN